MRRWLRRCGQLVALGVMAMGMAHPSVARAFIPVGHNMTLVPVPEIITDPNEGTTLGVLGTLLMSDDDGNVTRMIAPDVRWNHITGWYPSFRYYDYSRRKQRIFFQGGKATRTGEYIDATYAGDEVWHGRLDLRGRIFHENDPFERFYGFGNGTRDSAETNYLSDSTAVFGSTQVNVTPAWHAGVQARVRVMRVRHGGVDSVDQLVDDPTLNTVSGINGATIVGPRFVARYDTRDDTAVSTEGHLAEVGIEVIDKAFGASTSYLRYSVEERSFFPLRPDKRLVLATQAVLEYMQGGDRAPFYERSAIGGMRSLRGFGTNRYIDNDRFFARSEFRCNVWEPRWLTQQFHVNGHLEVAPFFETGRVFGSSRTFPLEDLHYAGGSGFRAVIPPQLVAYVDVGSTGRGVAVFTGVDYPF